MISSKNTEQTKAQIVACLNSCKFNPKDDTLPESVGARADSDYCVNRAIESIMSGNYKFAIKMLALAEVKRVQ